MRSCRLELVVFALLGACGPATPGVPDAASAPSFALTLGTGRDAYEELDADGTLVLERGLQGLQHVFVGVRAPIDEGLHLVEVTIEGEERTLSAPTRVNVPFLEVPEERVAELVGLLVVVPEPDGYTEGRRAILRVRVEARGGGLGTGERNVRLRW